MSGYILSFANTQLGDELIQSLGYWRRSSVPAETDSGAEAVVSLDDPLSGTRFYPKFRVRKKTADQWQFEQWVFDLPAWADGERRRLLVIEPPYTLVADYGECKLLSVQREEQSGPHAGRWSDQVILTFQSDTQPLFPIRS